MTSPKELRRFVSVVEAELPKIKGSRFIGYAAQVSDEAQADALLATVTAKHASANHVAWAYRLTPSNHRYSDAGEPRGTAGKPLFDRLLGRELEQSMLLAVRYFGGTKLGKGGLIRAYGAAGDAAISLAKIETALAMSTLQINAPPRFESHLRALIAGANGLVNHAEWTLTVSLNVTVPKGNVAQLRAAIQERTNGEAEIKPPVDDDPGASSR